MRLSAFLGQTSSHTEQLPNYRSECYETPASQYHFSTKSQWQLPSVPGLMYQFLLRQDGSLNFLFLTPSFGEFFELDSWEMELDTETLLAMIHPEDIDDFHNSIAIAAHNLESWKWAGRFILSSGETKWIQWDAQPSLQANGNIFWNGLLVDVTSHYQLKSEVERLSFLLGLTERLQTSTDLNEVAEFAIQHLVEATNSTFGDVKVIQNIDENSHACPLNNDMSAEFVAAYGKPGAAEIEVEIKQGILYGEGILWEVVETGEPMKEKFTTPTIQISTQVTDANTVLVRIADNGPGIPLALQPRLFDPFFTTKALGKGTGLGLSISHRIVTEKHGGNLKCISAPGEGAEFVIEIPLMVAKAA